jgi:hypothetical protein
LDWWQVYWLSFPRSVLTLKFTSQLGLEAQVTTDTIHMDTTIRTAIPTTDRIGITGIPDLTIGTAGTGITIVTTDITTTIVGNRLT